MTCSGLPRNVIVMITFDSLDAATRPDAPDWSEDAVRFLLQQLEQGIGQRPFDGRVPYKGLEPFREEDAGFFFGREALTQQLLRRIAVSTCLLVVGPSGCGKTSLVQAGLLAALKRDAIPSSARWRYAQMAPGRAPLQALGQAAAVLSGMPEAEHDLALHAPSDDARLLNWIKAGLKDDDATERAVLVIDSFEEIFTQTESESERQSVITQLCTAIQQAGGLFRLILTVRSDFIGAFARYPALNALVGAGLLQVGALSSAEVVRVVALPAQRVGLRVEPALVARIVADMRQAPEALPLLQFALWDLFKTQRDRVGVPQLTLAGYERRGGVRHALRRFADDVFDVMSPAQQLIARRLLRSLMVIGNGSVVTRQARRLADVSFPGAPAPAVHEVAQRLLKSRLLIHVGQASGLERPLTLSHEALLDAWPMLNALVMEGQTGHHWLAMLADAAAEWERHGRDPARLLAGTRLVHVRRYLADWGVSVPPQVQAYLKASWAHGPANPATESATPRRPRSTWLREGRAMVARYWRSLASARATRHQTELLDPSK